MWDEAAKRLEGSLVILEPLRIDHEEGLYRIARETEIWRWLPRDPTDSRESFRAWIDEALVASAAGDEVAFAILDASSGDPVGSTRYLALRPEHLGLEIGWTWIAPSVWRTGVNAEAKLLLLKHAFECLGCLRVEFKIDPRNERSRAALAALPAQSEGVLRKHRIRNSGLSDSAYYSIIDEEWPEVRASLERRLGKYPKR